MEELRRKAINFSPFYLNSFRLNGLDRLDACYRLIRYSGLLEADEDYEKKVRLLANILGRELRLPIEPIHIGQERFLAVVGPREQLAKICIKDQAPLNPEVVNLSLDEKLRTLSFQNSNGLQFKLARRALLWAIDGLAFASDDWWSFDRRFVSRTPDENASNEHILVYPAFYFGVVSGNNGVFELMIDPSVCYVERYSLFEKYGRNIPTSIKGRRFLHKYGTQWYKIDALGISNPADNEIIMDPNTGNPISIWEWIMNRWGGKQIPLIDSLSPDAPTVAYKTRGQQSQRAHSGLLFEMIGVKGNDDGDPTPHDESIMSPSIRGERTEWIIQEISSRLSLFGKKLNPGYRLRQLKQGEVIIFDPPKLRFAGDQEIATRLETAGRDRFGALRGLGPADATPFTDQQLAVRPESMPDEVWKDFKSRFLSQIHSLYGETLNLAPSKYDDRNARRLREQVRAIEKTIGDQRGYALMVLPVQKNRSQQTKLHHQIKRKYWKQMHTQCADLETILSFYVCKRINGEERWFVHKDRQKLYQSYLRYLALGYLLVSSKWLWKLGEGTLRNQVHVGIDVYKGMAVFTFIYGDAELITFHISKSIRDEKLSEDQVYQALVENLGSDLAALNIKPSSIVFHRDGKIYITELRGIERALADLQRQLSSLPDDLKFGIVEIHKTSATRPRVYRDLKDRFANPPMGLFARLSDYEGIVTNTGHPMLKHGTAHPLYFEVVDGNIDIESIAHDIYALSHLAFASPGSCVRLPFTIALADFVLRESVPGKDEPLWEEEDEEPDAQDLQQAFNFRERRF